MKCLDRCQKGSESSNGLTAIKLLDNYEIVRHTVENRKIVIKWLGSYELSRQRSNR